MSVNRIYVVADTHFGHRKVAEIRGWESVEAHDAYLVARWNEVVKPGDTVWHLGDVFLGGVASASNLTKVNGLLRLVMGNHDTYPKEVYSRHFSKILGAAELRNCILTHVPIHAQRSHSPGTNHSRQMM